ncbi:hypothetical protein TruAng_012143 [Truncatella angustata]|nr:hypothetical protein TruAng_012143 [Truncatella angustata]
MPKYTILSMCRVVPRLGGHPYGHLENGWLCHARFVPVAGVLVGPHRAKGASNEAEQADLSTDRLESLGAKRKSRLRAAAFGKTHSSPSVVSNIDEEDFWPSQKRRKIHGPRASIKGRNRLSGATSGSRSEQHNILTPTPSRVCSKEEDTVQIPTVTFEEWPLENAVLKRVTEGGLTTFQLQFTWSSCTTHGSQHRATRSPGQRSSFVTGTSTELSRSSRVQSEIEDSSYTSGQYDVEQIRDHRFTKPDNQGLDVRVKWRGDPKLTWEPVEELEDTIAFEEYLVCNDISKPSNRPKRGRPKKS